MRTDDETSQLCINETAAGSLKFIGPPGAHISRINEIVQVSSYVSCIEIFFADFSF